MSNIRYKIKLRKERARAQIAQTLEILSAVDRDTLLQEYRKLYDAVVKKTKLCEHCP